MALSHLSVQGGLDTEYIYHIVYLCLSLHLYLYFFLFVFGELGSLEGLVGGAALSQYQCTVALTLSISDFVFEFAFVFIFLYLCVCVSPYLL